MALTHVREGSGPPLLLVHGIGMSHRAWALALPLLAASRECVAVDLPGFGGSPSPLGAASVPALAAACADHMRSLGFETFDVAGLSLGGGIALELALSGAARAACALSPVGFVAPGREQRYLQASLVATRAASVAVLPAAPVVTLSRWARKGLLAQMAAHGDRLPPALVVRALFDLARARGFAATRRDALHWACPAATGAAGAAAARITVAWGDRDRLLLYGRQAERARRRLPWAAHVTLPGVGHLAPWDDPRAVAEVVLRATAPVVAAAAGGG